MPCLTRIKTRMCEGRLPKWLSENLMNSQAPEAKQSEVYTRKLKKCESRSRFSSASKTCHVWKKLLSTGRIITSATSRAHVASVDPFRLLFLCVLVILPRKQHTPRVKNTTPHSNYLVLPLTSSISHLTMRTVTKWIKADKTLYLAWTPSHFSVFSSPSVFLEKETGRRHTFPAWPLHGSGRELHMCACSGWGAL